MLKGGQIDLQRLCRCLVVIGHSTLEHGPVMIVINSAMLLLLLIVTSAVVCCERGGIVQVRLRPEGQRKHAQVAIDLLLLLI